MKKLLSTNYSAGAFNFALLLLRIILGLLIMKHGYNKMLAFGTAKNDFVNFLGIGSILTLALVIFAEFFCGLFIVLGLFTRLSAIPLIVVMGYIVFILHHGDVFDKAESACLYLIGFLTLLIVGPGKISVDGMAGK